MTPFHAAVWIDHKQAKVFHVEEERFDEALIHAPNNQVHRDTAAAHHFYHQVAEALASSGEILVVGPGSAKLELVKHVAKHDHKIADKIIGVETVDHPTDKQLIAYVRKYFHEEDRMRGLVP
jgi:stalled ribosome rescue protein Dom34